MKIVDKRKNISFIAIFFLVTFSRIMMGMSSEQSNQMSINEALDQKRLRDISTRPTIHGSGGPLIPLPDGSTVTRDVIFEAIQPLLSQGQKIVPDLIKALKNKYVHIRFGAYLALKLITKTDIKYYPFLEPDDPKNLKSFEKLSQDH